MIIVGCVQQGGKPIVPQNVELSSNKQVSLVNEEIILNLKVSSSMELNIDGFDLELYPGYKGDVYHIKENTIDLEDNFEVIEGNIEWTGTVDQNNPKELVLKLKALKEGKYSIATLVNTKHGGKREFADICIVDDLAKSDEFCAKKERTDTRVEAIETNE